MLLKRLLALLYVASKAPSTFSNTERELPVQIGIQELTSDTDHTPYVVAGKHLVQDQTHHGQLQDASHGRDQQGSANAEIEGEGEDRIEDDEQKADADVEP